MATWQYYIVIFLLKKMFYYWKYAMNRGIVSNRADGHGD